MPGAPLLHLNTATYVLYEAPQCIPHFTGVVYGRILTGRRKHISILSKGTQDPYKLESVLLPYGSMKRDATRRRQRNIDV